jgi:8-oxo-dGTP pyrophosphatase MutT (NUDIX family)
MDTSPFRSLGRLAAAVCYRLEGGDIQFLLVRTAAGRWTFPKGRIDPGEMPWQAAEREALEEAGVRGRIQPELLATYPYEKRLSDGHLARMMVSAYLLCVQTDTDKAESGRNPTWFSPEQAKRELGHKRETRYREAFVRVIDQACERLASGNKALPG